MSIFNPDANIPNPGTTQPMPGTQVSGTLSLTQGEQFVVAQTTTAKTFISIYSYPGGSITLINATNGPQGCSWTFQASQPGTYTVQMQEQGGVDPLPNFITYTVTVTST